MANEDHGRLRTIPKWCIMVDVIIQKKNESYIEILAETSILYELRDCFSFYADGYKFHPKYKQKLWDGRILLLKLVSKNKGEIYYGLLKSIIDLCNSRGYTFELSDDLKIKNKPSTELLENYTKSLNIGYKNEKITLRDYQIKGFIDAIQNKRNLTLSVTSSGKSAVIYSIVKYLTEQGLKGLVIVPNVSLIHQIHNDFIEYSCFNDWNHENVIHKIYSGQDKNSEKLCQLSTWQSLMTIKQNSFFESFDYAIVDECFCKGTKVLTPEGYINIEDIKTGDLIINYNEDTKEFKTDYVISVFKNLFNSYNQQVFKITMEDGQEICVTGNHKILTKSGWKRVDELDEFDEIFCNEQK